MLCVRVGAAVVVGLLMVLAFDVPAMLILVVALLAAALVLSAATVCWR